MLFHTKPYGFETSFNELGKEVGLLKHSLVKTVDIYINELFMFRKLNGWLFDVTADI